MTSPYRIAITHFGDLTIGPVHHRDLIAVLGSDEAIWRADRQGLMTGGLSSKIAEKFIAWRHTQDPLALAADVAKRNISVISLEDDGYPVLLKAIHDAPYLLYYRGVLPPANALLLGVVGSRKASEYGLRAAADLSRDLARRGLVIVSGLAYGIDEAAHKATLEANGVTVAILACGVDGNDAYRKGKLADEIVAHGGCVISEFPPLMPPLTHHFPIRNRIISGLSKATLVVEAAEKSGSLITARAALDENREVFAVPGPINSPTSLGTNRLCRDGAHVVTCADDIALVLGLEPGITAQPAPRDTSSLSPEARAIYTLLSHEPIFIDDIARQTTLAAHIVGSTLTLMEIEGWTRHLGAGRYIR